ncbi:methyltransferase domain-containing protein [Streptomyces sp. BK022]|uniref:SAM-dependent methyltransferase n=1 Tax=Streptomyces sp. BK022 TaxID=2512123 RepID=UPI001F5F96C3|nr:methyltransferase domain-containing protein [Streptomyces sp. BK022]
MPYTPRVPERLGWTPWEGIGPGAEVLGDVTGRRVLDIGSGAGHHAVHLAQAHGARVTGIELSPTQTADASPTLSPGAASSASSTIWKPASFRAWRTRPTSWGRTDGTPSPAPKESDHAIGCCGPNRSSSRP